MNFTWPLAIGLALATDSILLPPNASFSEINPTHIEAFAPAFTEYCDMASTQYFENNAVISSFFGDHAGALFYATEQAVAREAIPRLEANASEVAIFEEELRYVLNDDSTSSEEKQMAQAILTVDQEVMKELLDSTKVNDYYQYALNHYALAEPTVFTQNGQVVIDPLNALGIDIQVYHPKTQHQAGVPTWLLSEDRKLYELPTAFEAYDGHLLQVVPSEERVDAVPVDQFVISAERKSLLLPPGSYQLRIIDCSGTLVGTAEVVITS